MNLSHAFANVEEKTWMQLLASKSRLVTVACRGKRFLKKNDLIQWHRRGGPATPLAVISGGKLNIEKVSRSSTVGF